MSSSPPVPASTRPATIDRLALLELLGAFVSMAVVFGIFTARVIAVPNEHGYTPQALTIGFAIGAGIALAFIAAMVWTWRRAGGRPAQRRAMRVWRSGVLPDSSDERTVLLRNYERQQKTLTRGGLSPTVAAVIWALIAAFQIASARELLTPVAWVLLAAWFIGQAIETRSRQRRLPQLENLIRQLRTEEP